jgi:hypothetical protein
MWSISGLAAGISRSCRDVAKAQDDLPAHARDAINLAGIQSTATPNLQSPNPQSGYCGINPVPLP